MSFYDLICVDLNHRKNLRSKLNCRRRSYATMYLRENLRGKLPQSCTKGSKLKWHTETQRGRGNASHLKLYQIKNTISTKTIIKYSFHPVYKHLKHRFLFSCFTIAHIITLAILKCLVGRAF